MFSFITGKVLSVFMKFFLHFMYNTLTNVMAYFCVKIQKLKFVFELPRLDFSHYWSESE